MGYQALLFCPDEKTARTVTQVLSELEFAVEASVEPFAAVKKLMGQHFDAIVVDCDNEQNATLLFKSARNSASNQAALAVAVVEGQAGVAKAFRIGANLVLTKPINVEQAKGTLRVARGLLRKGEPAKSAAPSPVPVSAPAKGASPATSKPASAPAPRPAQPVAARPAASAAWPQTASAAAHADSPSEIRGEGATASSSGRMAPASPMPKTGASAESKPAVASAALAHSGGAASAPAPAREVPASHLAAAAPSSAVHPAEAASSAAAAEPVAAPSFALGGSEASADSGVDRKKIFLGIAAVVLIVAGIVTAWSYFGRRSQSAANPASATPASAATAPASKPGDIAPTAPAPVSTAPASAEQPVSKPTAASTVPRVTNDDEESAGDETGAASTSGPAKSTNSATPAASKAANVAKPEAAPLVVKGGEVPKVQNKAAAAAADAPAPSMIGLATPGSGGSLPNIVNSGSSAPRPILQTLNISQGVSQGLLMKKVQPVYPRNALSMRVEGTVQLLATISKSGDISAVKVLSGPAQLTGAAADAVKQWKYKPYLLNGEPVEIQTQVTVVFRLPR
ncbi:MAG TPA: TonB family protein [Candidatus Acidoferrales bacterium]|nr:TonB family protein [Candidatus Acidoferrales bacterium]